MASLKAELVSSANICVPVLRPTYFQPHHQNRKLSAPTYLPSTELSNFGPASVNAKYFCLRDINDNLSTSPLIMYPVDPDASPMISQAAQCKSMGAFASALANSRYKNLDSFNNNYNASPRDTATKMASSVAPSPRDTATKMASSVAPSPRDTATKMASSVATRGTDSPRVPVNGEAVEQPRSRNEVTKACTIPVDTKELAVRNGSISGACATVPHVMCRDFMVGSEPWKDDSLSLSSSFSSSISSLPSIPSPPSPASPPSFRPQSLPQAADIVVLDSELMSSSLPDSAFLTAYYTNSCGGSPRKRVKDKEGFIRRAACVCVNAEETEVMLVSSKSSSEVWLVPGGGLEEGEDAQQAALREAYEEAGVRGTILAYLGLFESRPEVGTSSKKHRTAVYVVRVTKEEDDFPEFKTHGRQRKWMSVDDALLHLSCFRPRQSVYLQLLRATRLKERASESNDDSCGTKTLDAEAGPTSALVDQYRRGETIQLLEREDSEGSVVADESLAIYEEINNDEETLSEDVDDLAAEESVDVAEILETLCHMDDVPNEATLTDSDTTDLGDLTSSKSSAASSSNESLVTPGDTKSPHDTGEASDLRKCVVQNTETCGGADVFAFQQDETETIVANDVMPCDEDTYPLPRTCSVEPMCSELSFIVNSAKQVYY